MSRLFPRHLRRDENGVTVVEFAMVAPVMLVMMMGFFEFAHQEYVRVVLQGAVARAARESSLETGLSSTATIDAQVEASVRSLVGEDATFQATRLSYASFSEVGTPERFVDAAPLNGVYNLGECFEDVNANGQWDADLGRSGQGGARDAVLYRMTVSYDRFFPVHGLIGLSRNLSISATTVMRNQPYGVQTLPTVVACP